MHPAIETGDQGQMKALPEAELDQLAEIGRME
jgi:hypothetical protein